MMLLLKHKTTTEVQVIETFVILDVPPRFWWHSIVQANCSSCWNEEKSKSTKSWHWAENLRIAWFMMVYDGDHPKGSKHPASMADHEPFSLVLFHFSRAATVSPTLSQAHLCNSKVVSFWFFLSAQAGQAACVFGPLGVSYQDATKPHPTIIQRPTICLRSARVVLGPPSLLRPSQHEVDNSEGFEGTSPALFWVDITWTRVSWAKHAPKYAAFNWGKEM